MLNSHFQFTNKHPAEQEYPHDISTYVRRKGCCRTHTDKHQNRRFAKAFHFLKRQGGNQGAEGAHRGLGGPLARVARVQHLAGRGGPRQGGRAAAQLVGLPVLAAGPCRGSRGISGRRRERGWGIDRGNLDWLPTSKKNTPIISLRGFLLKPNGKGHKGEGCKKTAFVLGISKKKT